MKKLQRYDTQREDKVNMFLSVRTSNLFDRFVNLEAERHSGSPGQPESHKHPTQQRQIGRPTICTGVACRATQRP